MKAPGAATPASGEIVKGKRAISPDHGAPPCTGFIGTSAEFWMNLQQMYDLSKAKLGAKKNDRSGGSKSTGSMWRSAQEASIKAGGRNIRTILLFILITLVNFNRDHAHSNVDTESAGRSSLQRLSRPERRCARPLARPCSPALHHKAAIGVAESSVRHRATRSVEAHTIRRKHSARARV